MEKPTDQVIGLQPLHLQGKVCGVGRPVGAGTRIAIIDTLLVLLEDDPDPRAPEVARILTEQRAQLEKQVGE